jgi:2-polyprenyl-6-methoxyphenol hydroxylase-like FAD-dependent oxidoreductase
MMLGFLLARAGVQVHVLEKHSDFLRDFRGDTVHPSTLELMHELGLLSEFLKRPHSEVTELGAQIGSDFIKFASFKHINAKCKFLVFMPQWDFLNFLQEQARRYPTFNLMMNTEAQDIIVENDKVVGIKAVSKNQGDIELRAPLTVAADGRGSVLREKAGMQIRELGAPIDVLWFRISRKESDPPEVLGRVDAGTFVVMLNRNEYWQCGFVIPKGGLEEIKQQGLDAFKARLSKVAPFLTDRVDEVTSFDDLKLLTVRVDRLEKWHRDGFLCIGDCAHAMSPVGGVGINLAIQDAVATANLLWKPLAEGTVNEADLQKVEDRRLYPTRMTQRFQLFVQNRVVKSVLESSTPLHAPLPMKAFNIFAGLRNIPATVVGIGFRPEHIHSPAIKG